MKNNQYLVLLASILILSSYGTVNAANWRDDIRGDSLSGMSLSEDTYFGLGYSVTKFSVDGASSVDLNPTALVARFGTYVTENISIEGRYGIGVEHDSITTSGVRLDEKIDSIFGAYGLVHADLSADVSVYALLGVTRSKLTATVSTSTDSVEGSDDFSGVSFGAGLDIGKINIEFTQYIRKQAHDLNDTGHDLTAISLSYTF
jgi:hypothetical protein